MSEIDPKLLLDLIGEYFDLGYAEGAAGRDADTMAGDAQRVLSEITALIQSQAAEIERLTEELRVSDLEGNAAFALAVDDPGKNPPVTWKDRAESAEADLARAREALAPFVKASTDVTHTAIIFDNSEALSKAKRDARAALPNTTGEAE